MMCEDNKWDEQKKKKMRGGRKLVQQTSLLQERSISMR